MQNSRSYWEFSYPQRTTGPHDNSSSLAIAWILFKWVLPVSLIIAKEENHLKLARHHWGCQDSYSTLCEPSLNRHTYLGANQVPLVRSWLTVCGKEPPKATSWPLSVQPNSGTPHMHVPVNSHSRIRFCLYWHQTSSLDLSPFIDSTLECLFLRAFFGFSSDAPNSQHVCLSIQVWLTSHFQLPTPSLSLKQSITHKLGISLHIYVLSNPWEVM